MTCFVRSKIIALLLIQSLLVTSPAPAQDATQGTRPRRVSDVTQEPSVPEAAAGVENSLAQIEAEPTVRIGLVTNARSVTISTSGTLLHTVGTGSTPAPLEVARVRIEPRAYPRTSPLAVEDSIADSDGNVPLENTAGEEVESSRGAEVKRDGAGRLRPPGANSSGAKSARMDEPARANAGTTRSATTQRTTDAGSVRLAGRISPATRGAVMYAKGTSPLTELRAPVTFASADESQHSLRFNEKAYRGRLEVFANTRGTLTVVNVLGLEDYVRGVVPNELSPGSYPALEALKAQAVAARTYAVSHRGQFSNEGFDLLPTTRSQVYGGRQSEHQLTDRAVEQTRGRVATYKGEIINALYTSTCGGRTEHAENIFGGASVPYLRARECAAEGREALAPHVIKSSREPASLRNDAHTTSARDAALLLSHNFQIPQSRLTDEWLSTPVALDEVRALLNGIALLARQRVPVVSNDAVRPPAFSTAIAEAIDGESRAETLLNKADVDYLLAFRDADEIPSRHRADVALLLRDGHLALHTDATLRPRQPLSRALALRTVAHLLEARGLFRLQKATARPATSGALVIRPAEGRGAERTLNVGDEAYLFRAFGETLYPVRELTIVGGEPVVYHTDARGEVDYIEVRAAPSGASAERFSPFTNWAVTLTPSEVSNRLARWMKNTGALVDLRVVGRGASRRVLDLEITGTNGAAHLRGGRIRSALGLREQLFVIEKHYDESGRINAFVFKGRGWGHGVGMCQVGAYGLARNGLSYEKILKSYYTGIAVTKLY